jgi:hypothetical protein
MREIGIDIPSRVNDATILRAIEQAIGVSGLVVSMCGSLKKYPGCVHWHVRQSRAVGTLEITFWPLKHRAWFTVHDRRAAAWIDDALRVVASSIASTLRG